MAGIERAHTHAPHPLDDVPTSTPAALGRPAPGEVAADPPIPPPWLEREQLPPEQRPPWPPPARFTFARAYPDHAAAPGADADEVQVAAAPAQRAGPPVPAPAQRPRGLAAGAGTAPIGLTGAQLGSPEAIVWASEPIPVTAWVPGTDGRHHLLRDAAATAWITARGAVRIAWRAPDGAPRAVWVWANAVERGPPRESPERHRSRTHRRYPPLT